MQPRLRVIPGNLHGEYIGVWDWHQGKSSATAMNSRAGLHLGTAAAVRTDDVIVAPATLNGAGCLGQPLHHAFDLVVNGNSS
jgi:hypothetical protein